MTHCPCGTKIPYARCCGLYHTHRNAPTALALMRSRYSAFCLGDIDYIDQTMKNKARLTFNPTETKTWAGSVHWLDLQIVDAFEHPSDKDKAFVEFIARFKAKNTIQLIHELSEFRRIEGRWYYVDGAMPSP